MNFLACYTETSLDSISLRKGGLILKGQSRSDRQPVHIILLIDNSGSMDMDSKLTNVKRSCQMLVNLLNEQDRLSLITFADDSHVLLRQVQPTAQERQAIQYRIQTLRTDGSTNLSSGLLEARGVLEVGSTRKQGIVVLTDGHANIGVTSEDGLLGIVNRIQTEHPGTTMSTVGYGSDHVTQLLTNMAKSGGGSYNVVNTLEDVASVFGDILGGLVSVSAQKVEIELPVGAEARTSFVTKTDQAGVARIYIGDVYADAEITVLFRSNPRQGPIRVTGVDMSTLNPIDTLVQTNEYPGAITSDLRLVMAEYRYATQQLLERLRSMSGDTVVLKRDIETLLAEIQQNDRVRADPLTPMLIEDLEAAKTHCEQGRRNMTQEAHTVLAQHSAYLGMARGLRAAASTAVAAGSAGTPMVAHITNFASPFSNQVQQQFSQALRATTSQVEDDSQS